MNRNHIQIQILVQHFCRLILRLATLLGPRIYLDSFLFVLKSNKDKIFVTCRMVLFGSKILEACISDSLKIKFHRYRSLAATAISSSVELSFASLNSYLLYLHFLFNIIPLRSILILSLFCKLRYTRALAIS